ATSGGVFLRPRNGSVWSAVKKNFPLMPGDTLRTDPGAMADITVDGKVVFSVLDRSKIIFEKISERETLITLENGYLVGSMGKNDGRIFSVAAPIMQTSAQNCGFVVHYSAAGNEVTAASFGPGALTVNRVGADGAVAKGVKVVTGKELTFTDSTQYLVAADAILLAQYQDLAGKNSAKLAKLAKTWKPGNPDSALSLRERVFSKAEDAFVSGDAIPKMTPYDDGMHHRRENNDSWPQGR
ncbi:MAG: hypothetical protein WCS77_10995, partial [Elusimicrobiaceae bacterium]